ncbi:allophanate hydrolase [Roseomonas nitratireducens]|uniref:allophanate hydrolase n=1 Tax=Roseomonas nitratireducens TaxID=2820810 RepID=UPI001FD73034|nr:allophanate hydrolase [Neoroseomonas nitratireducens]
MNLVDHPFRIAALHAAYAAGATPAAVLAEARRRLTAAEDPGIFLDLTPEADLAAAIAALPSFDPARFPLWGIPVAVKDNIAVAGRPMTAACPAFAHVPTEDATAVARLRAAGALVLGKANLDQFATGLVGVRTPYPAPRNALAPDRVPGGSSSGSAVAVARGIVAIALGTDTAGSGRVPAALNGIVGLKPSLGAVSTRGVVPACRSLDCVSVFAADVEDAWTALRVLAGEDRADPFSRPIAWAEPGTAPARIAIPAAPDLHLDEAPARAAWVAARGLLPGAEEASITALLDTAALLYDGPWVAERAAAFGDFAAAHPGALHPVTQAIVAGAARFSAVDAFRGMYRLAEHRRAAEDFFARFDVLAVPSVPCFPTLAALAADPFGPNARLGTYTNFVNLLDLAALAVPGPPRPDGLPAGITLIGPRGSDAALAALGKVFAARVAAAGKADAA